MKNKTLLHKLNKIFIYNILFGFILSVFIIILLFRSEYNKTMSELDIISNIINYSITEVIVKELDYLRIDKIISSLSLKPNIISGYLVDIEGNNISEYISTTPNNIRTFETQIKSTIRDENDNIIGYLFITATLNKFVTSMIIKVFIIISIFSVFIMLINFIIRNIVDRIIDPVYHLKNTIIQIMNETEITPLCIIKTDTEIDDLVIWFNSMIEKLSEKDKIIHDYMNDLENQVKLKTKELKDINKLYYNIINTQQDCIFRIDVHNKILFANDKFCKLFYNGKNCVGEYNSQNIHRDDKQIIDRCIQRVKEYPYYDICEYRSKIHTGEYRWWNAQLSGIIDKNNNLVEIQFVITDITNQKEIDKIIENERKLFTSGPVFIMILDNIPEYNIIYISENVEEILGYSINELLGISYIDLIHPADLKELSSKIEHNLKNKIDSYSYTYRLKHKNKFYVWVYDATRVIRDNYNNVKEIRGYLIDETDKRQAEQNLKESEAKYESLIENLSDCIFQLDLDFNFIYCSNQINNILGISPDKLIGTKFKDLFITVHDDLFDNIDVSDLYDIEIIGENFKTKQLVPLEIDIGSYYVDGEHRGYQGTLSDIGYRKKLEKELMLSSKMLLDILDTLPMGIIIVDDLNTISYKNINLEQLNLPIDNNCLLLEKIQHNSSSVIKKIDDTVHIEILLNNIWYEIIFKEIVYKMKDSKLVIFNNIHDKKVKSIDLEEKIKERTHQLEQTNKELESFAYAVSHDITAPLRRINGQSNIIRERYNDLDPYLTDKLKSIEKNAILVGTLIDGILQLSRDTRGNITRQKFNMSDSVRKIYNLTIKEYNNINSKLILDDPLYLYADYKMMYAVFFNLIKNAIKFSQDNDEIIISIGQKDNIYYVSDNGPGITGDVDRIFEVFTTTNNKYSGTGIGLATVYRVISKHNGKIWVDSQQGNGTTFYFTIGK